MYKTSLSGCESLGPLEKEAYRDRTETVQRPYRHRSETWRRCRYYSLALEELYVAMPGLGGERPGLGGDVCIDAWPGRSCVQLAVPRLHGAFYAIFDPAERHPSFNNADW